MNAYLIYKENEEDKYDFSPEVIKVVISDDPKKVEAFVEGLREQDNRRRKILSDVKEKLDTLNIPRPEYGEEKKGYPRWDPGLRESQITPEMRAERDAIIESNKMREEAYLLELRNYNRKVDEATDVIVASLGIPLDEYHNFSKSKYSNTYSFELVEHIQL